MEHSFFDEYKGDVIAIISRTFYIDIGILVVAFCWLYHPLRVAQKGGNMEQKKKTGITDFLKKYKS